MPLNLTRDISDTKSIFGRGDRMADKFNINAVNGFGVFSSMQNMQTPNSSLDTKPDVTTFDPNTNYQVEKPKAVDTRSTDKSFRGETQDVSLIQKNAQSVGQKYMQADAQITETFHAAIKQALGSGQGGKLIDQLTPKPTTTAVGAISLILDPTGMVGAAYSAVGQLQEHANRTGNQDVLAQMDKALNVLAEAHEAKMRGEKPSIAVPDRLDFSEVTAQQAVAFLERNRAEDPVMQEVADVLQVCQDIQENAAQYDAHVNDVVTADKVELAIERDDVAEVAAIVEKRPTTAYEALQQSKALLDFSGLKQDMADIMPSVKDVAANLAVESQPVATQNLEAQAQVTAVKFETTSRMG